MKGKLRLLDHFNNMKIGRKIMSAFVMASIVPILTIQFIGYNMNSNSLKRKIDTLMVDNLTQLSERVDLTMDIYSNLVYQIYVDDKIIENVNTLLNGNGEGREVAFHAIYNRLQQAEKSVRGIRSISVICANGQSVTYDAGTGSSIENLWDDYGDLREIAPYRDVQGMPGMLVTPTTRHKGYDGDAFYFHISKCMYDYNNLDRGTIATIVMSVDESVLRDICAVAIAEDEAEYNINFITDTNGFVISYPNSFYTGISMNPKLTVQENVELSLLYAGVPAAERRERALAALNKVGLAAKAKNMPNQLSGGQQQRVSIARALAGDPSVILADEPTGALDSRTSREVLSFLQQLNREGNTIVLITHDNSIAVRAQRIIRLQDGRIIYDGPSDDPRAVVQPSEAGEGDTL